MNINLRLYKAVIPSIRSIVENNPWYSDAQLVSVCSVATGAPVVACAYYLAHIKGMTSEIQNSIDSLIEFYRIKEVEYINEFPPFVGVDIESK